MRAFVCTQWGGPEVLTLGEVASPECAPDEVIIKVHAWGVNSTDLVLIGGHYHLKPAFPFVPGMEVAGEVMEIGAGVSKFRVGDRVAVIVGMGGYAEYVAANESSVFALPADMGWAEATAATISLMRCTGMRRCAARSFVLAKLSSSRALPAALGSRRSRWETESARTSSRPQVRPTSYRSPDGSGLRLASITATRIFLCG